MEIYYRDHAFEFEPSLDDVFVGRLILDEQRRELLAALSAAEDESWYLDDDGERLPAEALFALSPWSCVGSDGPVKLLCRWLDFDDGTARFNTPDLYPGELFRWMRAGGEASDAGSHATTDGAI